MCFGVFTEKNTVGLAIFTFMATGASRYVRSGLLHVEGPSTIRLRELTEFVLPGAIDFELLQTYFVITLVQVSKCMELQRATC